jgi:DHA2 family multidrug resistance protein
LINVARNTGGSIGVALGNNVLAHREQFHQSRLVENAIPSNVDYQTTLQQLTQYFVQHGSSLAHAQDQAVAWIGQQVQMQAAYLAYIDVFWVMMLMAFTAVPFALILARSSSADRRRWHTDCAIKQEQKACQAYCSAKR